MSFNDTFGPWPGSGEGGAPPVDPTTGEPTTPATIKTDLDSGIPFWGDAPELWDTVTIAGFTFPGVASIGGEPKRKLDKKNAKGADGRTITDDGADGCDVEIVLQIWDRQQWADYQKAVPIIDPNQRKGKLLPVDVIHPALKLHGVSSVYIEAITLPTSNGTPQLKEVRIKATSWAPAPKKPKKSKSKTPNESSTDSDDIRGWEETEIRDENGNLIATEIETIYEPGTYGDTSADDDSWMTDGENSKFGEASEDTDWWP